MFGVYLFNITKNYFNSLLTILKLFLFFIHLKKSLIHYVILYVVSTNTIPPATVFGINLPENTEPL